jgi:hypothetical protein
MLFSPTRETHCGMLTWLLILGAQATPFSEELRSRQLGQAERPM